MTSSTDEMFADDEHQFAYTPDQFRHDPLPGALDALDRLSARCMVDLNVPDDLAVELRDLAVQMRRLLRRAR